MKAAGGCTILLSDRSLAPERSSPRLGVAGASAEGRMRLLPGLIAIVLARTALAACPTNSIDANPGFAGAGAATTAAAHDSVSANYSHCQTEPYICCYATSAAGYDLAAGTVYLEAQARRVR